MTLSRSFPVRLRTVEGRLGGAVADESLAREAHELTRSEITPIEPVIVLGSATIVSAGAAR